MKKVFVGLVTLYPYLALAAVWLVFFDAFSLSLVLYFLGGLLAFVSGVVLFLKKEDAAARAKTAMTVKLVQIPAYIAVFVSALLLLLTPFTFGFSILLFLADCLSVFTSGLIGLSAVLAGKREGLLAGKRVFWYGLLQFVFCADVVASVLLYRKLK